jgi:hypothetical protein
MNAGSSFSRKLLGLLFAVAGVLHFSETDPPPVSASYCC